MEGMRDVALADYENLPDEEKANIHNDFKQILANGSNSVSDYIEFFQGFPPQIVHEILQNCEGYEEGRLDFNDFITIKYVLEKRPVVRCDGCSSVILGRPYFSCYECFFDFPVDSYDLCSGCYRSKKFEDHDHKKFYESQELQFLCRSMVAEKKELETRNNRINRAVIEFASKFWDFAGSITTDGLENNLDTVLNFDKKEKLGHDSKEPEEEEEEANLAMARLRIEPQEVLPPIDLYGAMASEHAEPCNWSFDKNKKLGRDSKEPEEKQEEVIFRLKPGEVRPPIDLLREKRSEHGQPASGGARIWWRWGRRRKDGRRTEGDGR